MKKKIMSLSLLTLGICSMAHALEYKNPEVGFKKHAAPTKEMKVAEFKEDYKVENGVETDRQIASEPSDREPSSVVAKEKKKHYEPVPEKTETDDVPKPWLRKMEVNQKN